MGVPYMGAGWLAMNRGENPAMDNIDIPTSHLTFCAKQMSHEQKTKNWLLLSVILVG